MGRPHQPLFCSYRLSLSKPGIEPYLLTRLLWRADATARCQWPKGLV